MEQMNTISSKIIGDSENPFGERLTTFLLRYPRWLHSEVLTHRCFSRNSASSRAISVKATFELVENTPFYPSYWGKEQKGMQSGEEIDNPTVAQTIWKNAALDALNSAKNLSELGVHKSLVNRLLEPFMPMVTVITATDYANFFALRTSKQAQPEFRILAKFMLAQYLSNIPKKLEWFQWHIPAVQNLDDYPLEIRLKIATAKIARVSYNNLESPIDLQKDIDLHDRLLSSGHFSPFEMCAKAVPGVHANFKGWLQYRKLFPDEFTMDDLEDVENIESKG